MKKKLKGSLESQLDGVFVGQKHEESEKVGGSRAGSSDGSVDDSVRRLRR